MILNIKYPEHIVTHMGSITKNVTVIFNAYERDNLDKSERMLQKFAKQHKLVFNKTKINREHRRQCISSIHGCDGKGLLHSAFHVSGQQSDLLKLSYTSVKDGALMYIFPEK